MNPGAIFISLAILAIAVPYVINPLVNERKRGPEIVGSQKKEATYSRVDALTAIRDLDFDFQTGKVTQEDYEILRAQLVIQAAEVLQKDKYEDEEIEGLIRARLQSAHQSVKCEKCGGEIRPKDHFCPICGAVANDPTASNEPALQIVCPGCGKSVRESDMFCTGCGTRVNEKSTARTPVTNS